MADGQQHQVARHARAIEIIERQVDATRVFNKALFVVLVLVVAAVLFFLKFFVLMANIHESNQHMSCVDHTTKENGNVTACLQMQWILSLEGQTNVVVTDAVIFAGDFEWTR
jgi:uncharacterized membrane protein